MKLEFAAPEEAGECNYLLYFMCDSYLGCDQEYDLNFKVSLHQINLTRYSYTSRLAGYKFGLWVSQGGPQRGGKQMQCVGVMRVHIILAQGELVTAVIIVPHAMSASPKECDIAAFTVVLKYCLSRTSHITSQLRQLQLRPVKHQSKST